MDQVWEASGGGNSGGVHVRTDGGSGDWQSWLYWLSRGRGGSRRGLIEQIKNNISVVTRRGSGDGGGGGGQESRLLEEGRHPRSVFSGAADAATTP